MLGCRIYTGLSVSVELSSAAGLKAVWLLHWQKHPRAGLLFFRKKKQSVECSADSQKVMQCLKEEEEGGWQLWKTLDHTCIQCPFLTQHALCP